MTPIVNQIEKEGQEERTTTTKMKFFWNDDNRRKVEFAGNNLFPVDNKSFTESIPK